jgi:hypothetical protein
LGADIQISAPGEGWSAKGADQEISSNATVSAISVHKWMDLDQAMVKSQCDDIHLNGMGADQSCRIGG